MSDGEPTGMAEDCVSVSMQPAAQQVSAEEEEKDEAAESGHTDDEEDMDDINHAALPKKAVRPNTPTSRPQKADIWNHVRRIAKHDVPDRAMKIDCTHVCVYPLEEGENGEKRYCNTPLKTFPCLQGQGRSMEHIGCTRTFQEEPRRFFCGAQAATMSPKTAGTER